MIPLERNAPKEANVILQLLVCKLTCTTKRLGQTIKKVTKLTNKTRKYSVKHLSVFILFGYATFNILTQFLCENHDLYGSQNTFDL